MPRRFIRVSILAFIALACAAIHFNAPSPQSVVFPGRGKEPTVESAAVLLAKYYPAKSTAARYFRIAPVADGFAPPDMQQFLNTPGSHWKNPAKSVQPIFPKSFANPVRVRSNTADVSAIPEGGNPASTANVESDGSLIYRDAFGPGIDVVYRCEQLKAEEFIAIREPSEPDTRNSRLTFSWSLDTHGMKARLTPAHTIEFCDAAGVPRLRINAPEGKDASGKLLRAGHELQIMLNENRFTLAADTSGLKFPIVIDPTWSSTGAMTQGRYSHTATLLNNGKVLVSCGQTNSDSHLATCEIFDPSTGVWTQGNDAGTQRSDHMAILLTNGNVLVAGGQDSNNTATISCEIFDPSTGNWRSTGDLAARRTTFTVNLLNDGRVLATGGDGATLLGACELYDATANGSVGAWSATDSLSTPRAYHTATRLGDGSILIAGGIGTTNLTASEIYSQSTNLWADTGSLLTIRHSHSSVLLQDGRVLTAGGDGIPDLASCELFASGSWSATGDMHQGRYRFSMSRLSNGMVLVAGGAQYGPQYLSACELFDPVSGTWSISKSMASPRGYHTATVLNDGRILVAGGISGGSGGPTLNGICEIFDPKPAANAVSISGHWGNALPITLSNDSIVGSVSYTISSQPQHGTLSGTPPDLSYTATTGFAGTDSFTYTATDSFGTGPQGTVTINVTNNAPTVTASASQTSVPPNVSVEFNSNGTDADGDPLTYTWDFGDGATSSDQNPSHAYATVGDFIATVTVTDPAGATGTAQIAISVSKAPIPHLQTSDVVAFGGLSFTFDASASTDPENAIASYDWDFGDGTPHGSGQVISKVYDNPGTYTMKLTVTDSAGVAITLTRVIEVLNGSEAGLFNGFINYKVSWNRNTTNKDTLSLDARVNVGDVVVGKDTPVALEIAGQRFEGTLDLKQRDYSNPNQKWQIKGGIRGQPIGSVAVKLKIKNASLGLGFNQAGVTAGGDPHDVVSKDIPVHLEIGGRSFELQVPSDFKFNSDGTKARVDGESE